MLFSDYCNTLAVLEEESSRTALTQHLALLLQQLGKDGEVVTGMYMLKGRVAPEYIPLELNFSNKSFIKAINVITDELGVEYDATDRFGEFGDSGKLAEDWLNIVAGQPKNRETKSVAGGQKGFGLEAQVIYQPRQLTVTEVYDHLKTIALTTGKGTVEKKIAIVRQVILALSPQEARYFAKIVTGNLRLGVSNKTALDAISWAKVGDKSIRKELDRAFGLQADLGLLAKMVLVDNADPGKVTIKPGVPLAAELVEREKDANGILKRYNKVLVQPKYDGLRAQVHFSAKGLNMELFAGGSDLKVQIFSRSMESLTDMFPDLVDLFSMQEFDSIILDGEIIGFDENTGTFLPFQETIQRKRKYDVDQTATSIPIRYYVFDLLYYNDKDYTLTPLKERLELLKKIKFIDQNSKIQLVDSPEFIESGKLDEYFRARLEEGLEGIIAKNPESVYLPGKRGFDWIKLKANTHADLKDSVDVVVMGYYHGRGNRAKFGVGAFLMGIYDEKTGKYQTIAKVGSGLKDDQWPQVKAQLDEIKLKNKADKPKNYEVGRFLEPDVYVNPEIVVEVDADEITLSSNHTAGKGEVAENKDLGFSLRFPRIKKWGRDKSPQESTSIQELKRLYGFSK